jgi:hypothetical protein
MKRKLFMKRFVKRATVLTVIFVVLAGTLVLPVSAELKGRGTIYVNGEVFSGTLQEAITFADNKLVEVEGLVYTRPVGNVHDVTIQGRGKDARIELEPFYFDAMYSKTDVLTITGTNVVIRDLSIDAGFRVDFPLRIFGSARDVLIENVEAKHGTRGAVNILSPFNIIMRKVRANSSVQGGFYFDDLEEEEGNIVFEDCSTSGNLRTGVLIRNTYTTVIGLDLSGITCYEGHFAVEDRIEGSVNGARYPEIKLTAPPKTQEGKPIDTSIANFYPVEGFGQNYKHIRYGMDKIEYAGASSYIDTERYGFDTRIYYLFPSWAEGDQREGEEISSQSFAMALIMPFCIIAYLFSTIKNVFAVVR